MSIKKDKYKYKDKDKNSSNSNQIPAIEKTENIKNLEELDLSNLSKVEEKTENNKSNSSSEMNFLEHLEELRSRIIYTVIFLIVSIVIVAVFVSDLMRKIFLAPALKAELVLQNLQPFGQPFLYFKVIFTTALLLTTPFFLFQLWKFLSPALYEKERKWISLATFFTTFCFFSGVIFSYFVLIPSMLAFAANFGSELIANNIDVNEYFGFISMVLLATGAIFELPMLSFVLSKFGIITPKVLSRYRRHSIVIILIVAAVLTPTPDPVSQLIFAAPIFILYEISIFISYLVTKKQN